MAQDRAADPAVPAFGLVSLVVAALELRYYLVVEKSIAQSTAASALSVQPSSLALVVADTAVGS